MNISLFMRIPSNGYGLLIQLDEFVNKIGNVLRMPVDNVHNKPNISSPRKTIAK